MEAKIQQVSSLAQVATWLEQNALQSPDTLVVLDMDLTLTMPPLPVLIYLARSEYRAKLHRILAPLKDPQRRQILTLGLQLSGHRLVEQEAPKVIRGMQAKGMSTIVLTASLTGQFNGEAPIELQRFAKLQELGIIMRLNGPQREKALEVFFADSDKLPVYHQGILCASGDAGTNVKGPVLLNFLHCIDYFPAKIAMIDDKIENLNHVHHSLMSLNKPIQFIGFEYTGAAMHLPPMVDHAKFLNYWENLICATS